MKQHAVSKVRRDEDGRITEVVWGEIGDVIDTARWKWASPARHAPVAAVVAAIEAGDEVYALFPTAPGHLERRFHTVTYDGGWQTIALEGFAVDEREVHDMETLGD